MLKAEDLVVRMIDVSIRYPGPRDDACVTLEDDPPCSIVTSTRERVDADGEAAVTWSARAVVLVLQACPHGTAVEEWQVAKERQVAEEGSWQRNGTF